MSQLWVGRACQVHLVALLSQTSFPFHIFSRDSVEEQQGTRNAAS
jgi:hypothetical protein